MGFFDRLMDRLTKRGTKLVASGHPPADFEPETGSEELSTELQADYGSDAPAAFPPDGYEIASGMAFEDEAAVDNDAYVPHEVEELREAAENTTPEDDSSDDE
jgi:hypothetical protein